MTAEINYPPAQLADLPWFIHPTFTATSSLLRSQPASATVDGKAVKCSNKSTPPHNTKAAEKENPPSPPHDTSFAMSGVKTPIPTSPQENEKAARLEK